jgi:hypothetical protein
MAREIFEKCCRQEGTLRLVQDRHDNPERTDRWFVELNLQVRFRDEVRAREFLALVDALTTPLSPIDAPGEGT